jgi:alkylation response protein AidB-like acyl-CoA dehydrogenase
MDLVGADAADVLGGPDGFVEELAAFLVREMGPAGTKVDPADLTGLAEPFERELLRAAGVRGYLGQGGESDRGSRPLFEYVVARHDAPLIDTAATLAGYPVGAFGSAEQRGWFLPRMAAGEITMCAAYTESDAGTDLGALRTRAEPDGGGWLLSGTKTLVTGAHKADWCLTVARTGEPSARDMTMFLLPMDAPGVRVRRRPTMNGWSLDEIEFDAVRLGAEHVLGEPGGGWRQLAASVQAERGGLFYLGFARHVLDLLREQLHRSRRGGRPLAADPLARDALAALEVEHAAALRLAREALRAGGGPEAPAMAKVAATELLQRIAQQATELTGHAGSSWAPLFAPEAEPVAAGGRFGWEYLERVHGTIGVGPNEIQRDAIARLGLGLPGGPVRTASPGVPDPAAVQALTESEPGYDAEGWARELSAGWQRGGFPADAGGAGTFGTLIAGVGRLGASATPSPVVSGIVLSGFALAADPRARRRYLPELLAGRRRFACAVVESDGEYEPGAIRCRAERTGRGWVLDGTKCWVPYAACADTLLVVARTGDGHTLLAVDPGAPGVTMRHLPTLGGDRQCEIRFDGVRLGEDGENGADAAVGEPGGAWEALRPALARAVIAQCADVVGAAEAALDHAVRRVTSRVVRGRELGARQAVAHRCADMLTDVTAARAMLDDSVGVVEAGGDAAAAAALAKALCLPRCRRVTAAAHQLCGGEGVYADQPLHLWFRRVKSAEPALGDLRQHREMIAGLLLDG